MLRLFYVAMDGAYLMRWVNINTITNDELKRLLENSYIHYGFTVMIIVGIWLATEVKQKLDYDPCEIKILAFIGDSSPCSYCI